VKVRSALGPIELDVEEIGETMDVDALGARINVEAPMGVGDDVMED